LKNTPRKPIGIGSDIGTTNDGRNCGHISMNSRNIPIVNNRNLNSSQNNKKNSPSSSVMLTPTGSTKQQAAGGKFIFTSANLNQAVVASEKTSHTTNFS
jgi:hypothetical protein